MKSTELTEKAKSRRKRPKWLAGAVSKARSSRARRQCGMVDDVKGPQQQGGMSVRSGGGVEPALTRSA